MNKITSKSSRQGGNTTSPRIMIIGLGKLGSMVLNQLLKSSSKYNIALTMREPERNLATINSAYLTALQIGYTPNYPKILENDLTHESKLAEQIAEYDPDLIFTAVSLQSWWVIEQLPPHYRKKLGHAEVGPWLPMHLTLVQRIMKSIKQSNTSPIVVNASFPDVVHPVLDKIGLSPHVGIGNVANNVPALRLGAARMMGESVHKTEIKTVMHHYSSHKVSRQGSSNPAPYALTVAVDENDRTSDLDITALLAELPNSLQRIRGAEGTVMTAASAVAVIEEAIHQSGRLLHAPGPLGLPGGYPLRFINKKLELEMPTGLDLKKAIKINEESQIYEGIKSIDEDGSVHYTEENMSVMSELLNYKCDKMNINDSDMWAHELAQKYQEFIKRIGADR